MLADEADLKILQYPVLASPKLDGVRATCLDGILKTRSLKLIPNREVQRVFKFAAPLDGELIVGDPYGKSVFRDTMKVTSAFDADIKDLKFYVFDLVSTQPFQNRLRETYPYVTGHDILRPVPHLLVEDEAQLLLFEEQMLDTGYEGVMLRDPNGKYKFGRSTAREGGLLKVKRKLTSEARVVGFVEQMHNGNEAKLDNLGNMERSSHQANLTPMGTLGALEVVDISSGVSFNIGTGFTFQDRDEIWKNKDKYRGQIVSYEYLPIGIKDRPRHPAFLGFRMSEDT
jgi:DNA ligase-1